VLVLCYCWACNPLPSTAAAVLALRVSSVMRRVPSRAVAGLYRGSSCGVATGLFSCARTARLLLRTRRLSAGGASAPSQLPRLSELAPWECVTCTVVVPGTLSECPSCNGSRVHVREGDWICGNCGTNVFGFRHTCIACGERKDGLARKPTTSSGLDQLDRKCHSVLYSMKRLEEMLEYADKHVHEFGNKSYSTFFNRAGALRADSPQTAWGRAGYKVVQKVLDVMQTRIPRLSPRALAMAMHGLSQMRLQPNDAFLDAWVEASVRTMSEFNIQDLSLAINGLGLCFVKVNDGLKTDFLRAWTKAALRQLPSADSVDLTNVIRGLSKLDAGPALVGQEVYKVWSRICQDSFDTFIPANLVRMVYSLKVLDAGPSVVGPTWFLYWSRAARLHVPTLSVSGLGMVIQSLTALRVGPEIVGKEFYVQLLARLSDALLAEPLAFGQERVTEANQADAVLNAMAAVGCFALPVPVTLLAALRDYLWSALEQLRSRHLCWGLVRLAEVGWDMHDIDSQPDEAPLAAPQQFYAKKQHQEPPPSTSTRPHQKRRADNSIPDAKLMDRWITASLKWSHSPSEQAALINGLGKLGFLKEHISEALSEVMHKVCRQLKGRSVGHESLVALLHGLALLDSRQVLDEELRALASGFALQVLTHSSLTRSFIHSFTHSFTFLLIHSLTHYSLTSPHLTSPHLTSPHLTSPHPTSHHLTSLHFTSLTHSLTPSLTHSGGGSAGHDPSYSGGFSVMHLVRRAHGTNCSQGV
jgi:hypothetical protein